jgi:putative holliday junction resolvase
MKYLGIDYGSKRIGLAVAAQGIAFPHSVVPNDDAIFATLGSLVEQGRIDAIVVGDTRTLEGLPNSVTKEADAFMERLREETGLPVESALEAGSSVAVSDAASEKRDDAAAAFLLQRFLDMKGKVD